MQVFPAPGAAMCAPFGVLPIQEASIEMDMNEEAMETVLSYLQVDSQLPARALQTGELISPSATGRGTQLPLIYP